MDKTKVLARLPRPRRVYTYKPRPDIDPRGWARFVEVMVHERQRKCWSYPDLGRASGIHQSQFTAWLKGRRRPNRDSVHRLFKALKHSELEAETVYRMMYGLDMGVSTPEDCLTPLDAGPGKDKDKDGDT